MKTFTEREVIKYKRTLRASIYECIDEVSKYLQQ